MLEITSSSPEESKDLAYDLIKNLGLGHLISLQGPLGSGKTTFTKGIGQGLGIQRVIKSPTYTIVKEYPIPESKSVLYHIDAYRLENLQGETIDIDNFITDKDITVVEWAEYIAEYLPVDYLIIELIPLNNYQRKIKIYPSIQDSKYQEILEKFKESRQID